MQTEKKPPLLTPLVRWFMLAMILANIASNMTGPFLSIYLINLGADIGQVGLVFTITSVVILILQIIGGWVSDSIGRLRAIAIGSLGGIAGFIALLLAPTWQWMMLALIIYQLPFALVGPSFGAFLAENSSEKNRGRVYGLTGTIYQITGLVGPILGGFFAEQFNFKIMILVAAVFYVIAAGLRIWMATTMRSPQERTPAALSFGSFKISMKTMFGMIFAGGVLTWIFLTDGVRDIAFRMSGDLQPVYLEQIAGLSLQQIGILGSIFSAAMMFTPMLSGKLSDRYGERVPIVAGFSMVSVAYVIFLQSNAFPGFVLSWIIFGVGVGLLGPAYQSLISKVVPANLLGTFSGLFDSSIGVISLPAPWLGAQLWKRFSPRLPFIITLIASVVTLPLIWFTFKAPKKAEEPPGGGGVNTPENIESK